MSETKPNALTRLVRHVAHSFGMDVPRWATDRPNINYSALADTPVLFGDENTFPDHVARLCVSPTLATAVHIKEQLTAGDGWVYDENNAQLAAFIDNTKSRKSLHEVLQLCASDLIRFGGFYIYVRYDVFGNIAALDHMPFPQIRIYGVDSELNPKMFQRRLDWERLGAHGPIVNIHPFDETTVGDAVKAKACNHTQLYHYYRYSDVNKVYPLPDWWGVSDYVLTDIDMAEFQKNNVRNGFTPSYVVSFPSVMLQDERQEFIEQFQKDQIGPHNANKVIFIFTETNLADGGAPTVTPLNSDNSANIYNEVRRQIQEYIFMGAGVPSVVAGISSSSLSIAGAGGEMEVAFRHMLQYTIKPYQRVLTRCFRHLAALGGVQDVSSLRLIPNVPEMIGVDTALQLFQAGVVSRDELRALAFLPEADEVSETTEEETKAQPEPEGAIA